MLKQKRKIREIIKRQLRFSSFKVCIFDYIAHFGHMNFQYKHSANSKDDLLFMALADNL